MWNQQYNKQPTLLIQLLSVEVMGYVCDTIGGSLRAGPVWRSELFVILIQVVRRMYHLVKKNTRNNTLIYGDTHSFLEIIRHSRKTEECIAPRCCLSIMLWLYYFNVFILHTRPFFFPDQWMITIPRRLSPPMAPCYAAASKSLGKEDIPLIHENNLELSSNLFPWNRVFCSHK